MPFALSGGAHQTAPPVIHEIHELDWSSPDSVKFIDRANGAWACGKTVQVVDVQTGIWFSAYRHGGTNHVDWEPATQADTDELLEIYGKHSWDRRPVVVVIDGISFAASINWMPHGRESIKDNGFNGHACMHFLNSRTHGTNRVDADHQNAIAYALAANVDGLNKMLSDGNLEQKEQS